MGPKMKQKIIYGSLSVVVLLGTAFYLTGESRDVKRKEFFYSNYFQCPGTIPADTIGAMDYSLHVDNLHR